jgi:hypothetical protein
VAECDGPFLERPRGEGRLLLLSALVSTLPVQRARRASHYTARSVAAQRNNCTPKLIRRAQVDANAIVIGKAA